jgi:hypothetical protein
MAMEEDGGGEGMRRREGREEEEEEEQEEEEDGWIQMILWVSLPFPSLRNVPVPALRIRPPLTSRGPLVSGNVCGGTRSWIQKEEGEEEEEEEG